MADVATPMMTPMSDAKNVSSKKSRPKKMAMDLPARERPPVRAAAVEAAKKFKPGYKPDPMEENALGENCAPMKKVSKRKPRGKGKRAKKSGQVGKSANKKGSKRQRSASPAMKSAKKNRGRSSPSGGPALPKRRKARRSYSRSASPMSSPSRSRSPGGRRGRRGMSCSPSPSGSPSYSRSPRRFERGYSGSPDGYYGSPSPRRHGPRSSRRHGPPSPRRHSPRSPRRHGPPRSPSPRRHCPPAHKRTMRHSPRPKKLNGPGKKTHAPRVAKPKAAPKGGKLGRPKKSKSGEKLCMTNEHGDQMTNMAGGAEAERSS